MTGVSDQVDCLDRATRDSDSPERYQCNPASCLSLILIDASGVENARAKVANPAGRISKPDLVPGLHENCNDRKPASRLFFDFRLLKECDDEVPQETGGD